MRRAGVKVRGLKGLCVEIHGLGSTVLFDLRTFLCDVDLMREIDSRQLTANTDEK